MGRRRLVLLMFVAPGICLGQTRNHTASATATGQANTAAPFPTAGARLAALPNGAELTVAGTSLRVVALKDSVLRVREWRSAAFPEDASWAVLPAARTASVRVVSDPDGFHTATLKVAIGQDLRLTVSDLAGNVLQQDAAPVMWNGSAFKVAKSKRDDDHFFGLGDKPGPLDRAGEAFTMWNTDNFGWQESTDPIYKSIPFFIDFRAGHALGVLFDNTWRSFFDFGRETADRYTFGAPNGSIDYYLLYGPTPKRVMESYAWLTGPTPLPPLWSLGFQQSRYSYYPESQVLDIANTLRADRIPADAIYLDIDYQLNNRPFTVDRDKFPHFESMIAELAKKYMKVVAITDLHVANLPNAGYIPYDTGAAGDHFVKNPDGSVYTATVWPGLSVFPDFTRQASRQWWGTLYQQFASDGLAGFWNDMNEPAIFNVPSKTMPDTVQHRIDEPGFAARTASHSEIHNVYGMENSRATYEGLLALQPNQRPFVLTRASYAGGQRYAATWTGDNSSTWNHLRMTVPQIVNLGLSGFAMSGADVGGFAGSPPPDLLTRWLEVAAFQPIDRDHSAKGTAPHEPWVDGTDHLAIRRHFIEERYRLMPYLYTTTEEMSRTGLPIMRPLFMEFPDAATDGHPLDLDAGNEFLFGPDLLIAPAPYPEQTVPYEVVLPPGAWYDYWTGDKLDRHAAVTGKDSEQNTGTPQTAVIAEANKPVIVTPKLDLLPVYVRGGSILPIAPITQSTAETPVGPLTLRVYPAENCAGDLYQDDGSSFAYRQGAYVRIHLSCREEADGSLSIHIGKSQGTFVPWWREFQIEVYGWKAGSAAEATAREARVTRSGNHWSLALLYDRNGSDMTLR